VKKAYIQTPDGHCLLYNVLTFASPAGGWYNREILDKVNFMSLWLLVGLGGFVGAILRYWISGWIQSGFLTFPLGTFGVNFIGSLLLALIMYASEYRGLLGEEARVFLTIGVLGSFTTMSTFSFESIKLLEQSEHMMFGLNLIGTVSLCFLAIYLGKLIIAGMGMK
jgi:fluoride exporter